MGKPGNDKHRKSNDKANGKTAPSKPSKKKDTSGRRGVVRAVLRSAIVLVLLALAVTSVITALYVRNAASSLPSTEEITHYEADLSTIVYDRNQKVITRLFHENRTWVPFDKISTFMKQAVIAAEDSSFYDHKGVDPRAILRSAWINLRHGRTMQGASTITQQLARNLFLTREQTLDRKVREAILALRLERVFTKDRILEMYLNMIYFGHGAWGIHSAAQLYFNKEPSDMTLSEAAVLAGIIKAPEYYTPKRHPDRAALRQQYVLNRMREDGVITAEEADSAGKIELDSQNLEKPALMFDKAPHFISYILFDHLLPKYGSDMVYRGGLRVYTTIDLDVQTDAEEAIQGLKSEGAIVALEPSTGEILALVGGKDFEESKFNRATQAFRQPGSAFKPFVYTAALKEGIRPVDHVFDAPLTYDNGIDERGRRNIWEPGNYTGKYHGEVTILEALTHSYNTVAVRVGHLTGIDRILTLARDAGFTSPHLPADLSLSLGSASVTPLEMASAYSVFANGGFRIRPYGIKRVTTAAGEILEQHGPEPVPAVAPELVLSIRSVLENVVRAGTGRRAQIPGYETFGKTGTTNEYSDAWFAGGLPGLVTVVYAGHDDHKSLGTPGTGGAVAAPVWKAFVEKAVTKLPVRQHFDPAGSILESVSVCPRSGFLATANCPRATIALPDGMVPRATCPIHGGSWEMAMSDAEAPMLLLSPKDQEVLGTALTVAQVYSMALPEDFVIAGDQVTPPYLQPQREPETRPEPVPPKKAEVPVPRTQDPSTRPKERTPEQVEQRFQELLKQYGISD